VYVSALKGAGTRETSVSGGLWSHWVRKPTCAAINWLDSNLDLVHFKQGGNACDVETGAKLLVEYDMHHESVQLFKVPSNDGLKCLFQGPS